MQDSRLSYKIALAYYEQGLTQQEIALKYGISRIKVSRILARAQDEGIVHIHITPPEDPYVDLEARVEMTWNIEQVIIAGEEGMPGDQWVDQAGKVAAHYFVSIVKGHETVGLTWGRALQSFVKHLPMMSHPELKIVQMLGGLGEPDSPFHGADICRTMAQQCGTRPWLIHAPGIVGDKGVCRDLKGNLQVKGSLKLAAGSDMAIVGIGSFDPDSPLCKSDVVLTDREKDLLSGLGAVGDISLRFFREDGTFVDSELDDRVVGIGKDDIKGIGRIIGIAGGPGKYKSIRAVLQQKRIHVLVTDPLTAKRLIEDKKETNHE